MKSALPRNIGHCFALGLLFLTLSPFISAQSVPPGKQTAPENGPASEEPHSVILSVLFQEGGAAKIHIDFDTFLEEKYNFVKLASDALGCPLEEVRFERDQEDQAIWIDARCDMPSRRSFLTKSGSLDLNDFQGIQAADPSVAFLVDLHVPSPQAISCDPPSKPLSDDRTEPGCAYGWEETPETPAQLRFVISYDRSLVVRTIAILGLLLLLPIVITFWFRHRAQDLPDQAKPTLVFAYRRFLTWTALLGSLLWWIAIDLLEADKIVAFSLPTFPGIDSTVADILPWIVLILVPATVYFLCLCLSFPMQALRGTVLTGPQLVYRSFLAVARFVIGIPLIWIGAAETASNPRIGVPIFIFAFILMRLLSARLMRAYGIDLHSLTVGELRDRAFALAAKAKTRLNQLYLLPMSSMRIANAFAHSAQNIFLSDYLVESMSKREVDAVIAHEMTHLQKKHVGRRSVLTGVFFGAIVCGTVLFEKRVPGNFPVGPVLYGLFLLTMFFLSRRNEFTADAGAAALTGDPEAMMTALARLSRLNTMPLQWSKLDEKVLSHPSTMRRIERLARDANISEARTQELLIQAFAPPLEKYSIPATALPAGKIFSTRFKTSASRRLGWSVMLTSLFIPVLVAWGVRSLGFDGGLRWLLYGVGILVTLGADLMLLNFGPMFGMAKLEYGLRWKRQQQQPAIDMVSGTFVCLAPASEPRLYEGNWAWDLGFVSLTSDRLIYWGEEATFSLTREQVTSIARRPGPISWFGKGALYLSWSSSTGQFGVFNLRAVRGHSMRETSRRTTNLFRELENWHLGRGASTIYTAAATDISNSHLPTFGEVTSAPPSGISIRLFIRDLILNSFLAVAAVLVFGFVSTNDSSGSIDALPGLYIIFVVWLSRALIFAPFWLAKRKRAPAPSPMAVTPET
jgi:Zn-dependent protease with chaperone function